MKLYFIKNKYTETIMCGRDKNFKAYITYNTAYSQCKKMCRYRKCNPDDWKIVEVEV